MGDPLISIVMPVRDEPDLGARLDRLSSTEAEAEMIVVDTSRSPLLESGRVPGDVRYVHAPQLQTRAAAMNEGARHASRSVVLFLHADCELPDGAGAAVEEAVRLGFDGGTFLKRYVPGSWVLSVQAAAFNWAARRYRRGVSGTNAIFIRKERFQAWKGFAEIPLCEEFLLWDRLLAHAKVKVIPAAVRVSSRRYRRLGGLPRMIRNAVVYSLFRLGVAPRILARLYS